MIITVILNDVMNAKRYYKVPICISVSDNKSVFEEEEEVLICYGFP